MTPLTAVAKIATPRTTAITVQAKSAKKKFIAGRMLLRRGSVSTFLRRETDEIKRCGASDKMKLTRNTVRSLASLALGPLGR